jgi:hypothetical protein
MRDRPRTLSDEASGRCDGTGEHIERFSCSDQTVAREEKEMAGVSIGHFTAEIQPLFKVDLLYD